MNKEQISELAEAIVTEGILSNWRIYLLVVSLTVIGSYIANFITGYAKKRGQHLATKADINEIKKQLETTTELTEKIRNDIEHEVWRKQQIETIKRHKLEEYIQYIYTAQESLYNEMSNEYFKTNKVVDTHAKSKANMLQKLYFPELMEEHAQFLKQYAAFQLWLSDGMEELSQKLKSGEQVPIISNEHMEKYSGLINGLNAVTLIIEAKAEKISEEINSA